MKVRKEEMCAMGSVHALLEVSQVILLLVLIICISLLVRNSIRTEIDVMKEVDRIVIHPKDTILLKSCEISIQNQLQKSNLPPGCEITTLDTVLNYYHFGITKESLSNKHVLRHKISKANPNSPGKCSIQCEELEKIANSYLSIVNTKKTAHAIRGVDLYKFKSTLAKGNPVIIWVTQDYSNTVVGKSQGEEVRHKTLQHTVILSGYNESKQTFTVLDSIKGTQEVGYGKLQESYTYLDKQALMILE